MHQELIHQYTNIIVAIASILVAVDLKLLTGGIEPTLYDVSHPTCMRMYREKI